MRLALQLAGLLLATVLFYGAARAQTTYVWDGGHPAQSTWSLNQNWNPNGAPTNDGTANLTFTGNIRLTPDSSGAWNINSVTFDSAASGFTIIGGTLTLQATSVASAITNNSSTTQQINNALTLAASQTWSANTASLTLTGAISLGSNTLTVSGSSDTSASGVISGTGAVVKSGSGTLVLSGANTYSGGTTVSAGTLQGDATSLQGNIANSGAVVFNQAAAGTYAGIISGSGSFTKQNTGTLTLNNANTFTGDTAVNAGTLALGTANALASTTAVSVASGATVQLTGGAQSVGSIAGAGGIALGTYNLTTGNANTSTTFSGAITGTGSLTKTGTGTLTLSGANTYSGGTAISGGTLQGDTTSLQGNIANNAALVFDQTANGSYSGTISGTGSLTKQGTGTVTFLAANTFTGSTAVNGGTLALGTANALGSSTALTIASGAQLQLSGGAQTVGSLAGAGGIDLGAFTLTAGGANTSTTFSGAITGTGALVKNGTGTLTLSGANSYSGGTTINAGTLQGDSTSLQGNIANNAALVFDQASTGTYAGAISGVGSVTKQNSGTLVLSGANSYSGGTTVSAGTLQGTTTSLQGNIANNAAVVFNQTSSGSYAGVISGTGSVEKQNTGTVILTGANSYGGGTTISGGTLQGNTTSLQGNVANNAALVFDQSSAGTFAGAISGTGSVTKQNSGTLVLAGVNTYSGGTTISGGTLQGNTTSLQGNIANNAGLVFDQSSSGTFAGAISGTGSVTKQNSGTLTLAGTNTYSGGTTISAGTLQGSTTSLQGNIANNAALVFDQSTSGTYSGAISGTGSVTKQNTGTVTLTGANSYTGATTVSGGTLALGANNALSATSNLALNAGTTLNLAGNSAQVATFSYNTAIIDYGAVSMKNSFLFTGGGTSTGTLTINNFSLADGDVLAFQTGAGGITGSFVNGVYFYGIGGGVLGATGQTIAGYSGTWDFITPNAAAFTTWSGGGTNDNWSMGANWGGFAPVSGTSLKIDFDGSTRLTPVLDGSYTLNTLRFDATAGAFSLSAQGANSLTFDGPVPGIIQLSSAAQTVNVPLTLNTTTVVETTGAGNLTLSGVISGTGGIDKVGSNTLVLSGANTYTGTTDVSAGTLVVQNSSALGSTSAGTTVSSGATLQLENNVSVGAEALALEGNLRNASGANSYGGAISGNGTLTIDGGSLSLTGAAANTFTGATTVNSGALSLGKSAGVTAIAGNLTIGNGAGSATTTLLANEQVADTASVTLGSAGTPVFNLNGFTETIGSLSSSNTAAAVQLGAGALSTGGNNASTTFAGVISGTGSLTKQGTGTFTLSGANTYSGATTVSAGTLVLQNSSALGTTAGGTTVATGATLQLENNVGIGAEALTLNGTVRNASGANSFGGAISGSGSLTIDGGSLALTGTVANTFTGATTVNSGSLDLNKTAGLNAVAGDLAIGNGSGSATVRLLGSNQIADTSSVTLAAGGTPVFNLNGFSETIGSLSSSNGAAAVQLGTGGSLATGANNTSTTFAGVISGAGSLTKQGSGTFVLSGANTYTGGTTVSGGTLQGNTTSLQGNIANNAAVVFDQAANGTFSGVISGSGSVTKQNSGTLVLSGANTYSGGTTISGGTLQGNTASLQGNVANNGSLVFDQSSTGTFAGAISGTGSLTKQNTGTLILSGTNSYSGGTTVTAGTLQGNTSSLQGNIANNGAVVFNQATTGTYSGAISGSGSLTKQNTGTLVLTGANSYSGGTTVAAGTLQGNTSNLQGNIANSGTVVFDQSANGTYSGILSGTGGLTKQNSGTLTLSSANTYTGATTVSGGTLALAANNALAAGTSLTLASGTTLSLGGTISTQVNSLSFNNATINFGTTGTANYFLFNTAGTNSGTLTVANWTSGSDRFAVATNAVSQSFLDNILFSGIGVGIGAVLSSTPITVGSYGNFYELTPIPTFVWSGSASTGPSSSLTAWSNSNNWSGGIAPSVGAVKAIVMAGTVKTANDMNGAYQIKSLLFRSDAGAFNITSSTGDTLTIGGGGINNQSANTQTLGVSLALSADQTWTAGSGGFVFNGTSLLNSTYNLTITGGYDTSISAAIGSGSGSLTKTGTGTLTLSGTNTYTGGTTVSAGTLVISSDNNLGAATGGLTLDGGTLKTAGGITSARNTTLGSGGGTFDSNGFTSTLSGAISGSGALTKIGAGTLTLTGANSYTGGTTVSAGTLQGTTAGLQGNITNNAAVVFDQTTTGTYAGVISGSGSVTKQNTGTVILTGANSYSGGTTISGGTLQGTTASLHGAIVNNATLVFDQAVNGTYAAAISGTGALVKQNAGILTLAAANTYTGATTVSGGTLALGLANALSSTTALTIASGATVNSGGLTQAVGSLAGSGTLAIGTGTFAVGADNTSTTFGGAITGTGVLNKVGTGTLTFNSNLNFTGELNLSGGTISLAGMNVTLGTLRISGNTVLDFGSSAASTLTANSLIIENGAVVTITNWIDMQDFFYVNGSFYGLNTSTSLITPATLGLRGGAPQNQIVFAGFSNNSTIWQSYDHQITPAPEPATYGAVLTAAGLCLYFSRRRKRTCGPVARVS